ncbi:glycosyltransferase family 2 protein [Halorubrum salipaludis]|nr:glycosyltransferase family 2 protein [Halorubrum salipaludis]
MGDTDARQGDEDVAVTKSTHRIGADSQLVTVSVRADGAEPTDVTIADAVPETHALRVAGAAVGTGGSDGPEATYSDGEVVVDQLIDSDGVRELVYQLDGPADRSLPRPTVERVSSGPADRDASTRVTWEDADGEARRLTARTDGGSESVIAASEVSDPHPMLRDVAIGVVLTAGNEDAAIGTVLRARRRGHAVLVTASGSGPDAETVELLEGIGAVVIDPPSKRAAQGDLHRALSTAARERGLAGIVFQTRDCPPIDYERTAAAFERADYEVVAIPQSWTESASAPSVVVGVPAYNAAASIAEVVRRTAAYADEVVVVDDGSADETAERAREAGATVVVHERNRGYGGALKTLFREAAKRGAAHLVVIDADGQHDPAEIPRLVETQRREGTDIVIGSRYVGERTTRIPLVRSVGLAVINHLTNASLGNLRPSGFIRDTQSGYRAYSGYAIKSLANDRSIGDNMGASTDILYHAHRKRLSVSEVETTISYDVENASSQGSVSHGLDLVRNILWTVEYGRPLLVLGLPGAIVTLFGTVAAVLLFAQFSQTGVLIPARMIVSILYVIGGLLLCITAVMMHVLNRHPTMKRLRDDEDGNG